MTKPSSLLRAALVLGFALAMPIATSPMLLAGALAFGSHVHRHEHTLAVRADEGHVDVLLAHAKAEPRSCAHHEESVLVRAGCCGVPAQAAAPHDDGDGDHTLHVPHEGTSLAPRGVVRAAPPAALAFAAQAIALAPQPAGVVRTARLALPLPPPDLVRSTVLRI